MPLAITGRAPRRPFARVRYGSTRARRVVRQGRSRRRPRADCHRRRRAKRAAAATTRTRRVRHAAATRGANGFRCGHRGRCRPGAVFIPKLRIALRRSDRPRHSDACSSANETVHCMSQAPAFGGMRPDLVPRVRGTGPAANGEGPCRKAHEREADRTTTAGPGSDSSTPSATGPAYRPRRRIAARPPRRLRRYRIGTGSAASVLRPGAGPSPRTATTPSNKEYQR